MKKSLLVVSLMVLLLSSLVLADNLALNKKYVINYQPEATYPDSGGKELTDGKVGQPSIYDSPWSGHLRNEFRIFIIDLEAIYSIDSIKLGALKDNGTGVTLPLWLCYSVSNDGKRWKSIGTLDYDESELPTKNTVRFLYELEASGTKARYVAVKVNSGVWLFLDEIEVHGDPATRAEATNGIPLQEIDFEEIEFDY